MNEGPCTKTVFFFRPKASWILTQATNMEHRDCGWYFFVVKNKPKSAFFRISQ